MVAFRRDGSGEPLVLVHGTNCTHRLWEPLIDRLAAERDVIAVDLPAHGDSAPTSFEPRGFARDIAALLDELALAAPAVAGHSVGGWVALELAKAGRAGAVLAIAPAGLWRRRSPRLTDLGLLVGWHSGRILGRAAEWPLRTRLGRAVALGGIAAHPSRVPADAAVALSRDARAAEHFPRHFRETRALRFEGGAAIPPAVPVTVVWGARDRVARSRTSRFADELPPHAIVDTWDDCGHTTMWDQPQRTADALLALHAGT